MSDNPTEGLPIEKPQIPDFSLVENRIRRKAYRRVMELLDSDEKIPPGQLLSFVAKIGFTREPDKSDRPNIQRQNIFAILTGLPPERQREILDGFGRELETARKELESG